MNLCHYIFAFNALTSGVWALGAEHTSEVTVAADLPTRAVDATLFPLKSEENIQGERALEVFTQCPADASGNQVHYVDCVNGTVAGNSGQTCDAACGSLCCVGSDSCQGFTGKVCKDGGSCFGTRACSGATIGLVADSCNANRACMNIANNGGSVASIVGSCQAIDSCANTALAGSIAFIFGSCSGFRACNNMVTLDGQSFSSGLTTCCNEDHAGCKQKTLESQLPSDCFYTISPTAGPTTASPTKAPWDIIFKSMQTEFDSALEKGRVTLDFEVPQERTIRDHYEYPGQCNAAVTRDLMLAISPPGVLETQVVSADWSTEALFEEFRIVHNFNKTLIAASNTWNNSTNEIEICQVVELHQSYTDSSGVLKNLTISKDIRNITVKFNFTTEFEADLNLTGATIEAENATTDLSDYITAKYCDGNEAMNTVVEPLAPNEKLHVCVESSSTDVELDEMAQIKIVGENTQGSYSELVVVENDTPQIPAITSHYRPSPTKYILSTMVPIGYFNFEAIDASITVVGSLTLKLKGERRHLSIAMSDVEGRHLQSGSEDASNVAFDVSVPLTLGDGQESDLNVPTAGTGQRTAMVAGALVFSLLVHNL